jgi:hypothetical protein
MVRRLLPAALALCACAPITFGTTVTGNATVPAGVPTMMLAALPLIGSLSNLDFDNNPDFKSQGVTRADLISARASASSITLTQPMNATFSWLDELQLVAKNGDTETVFADELDIAARNPPSPLSLTITSTDDVVAEVSQTPMSFVMRGKGRQPAMDIQVQISITLQISAAHPK